MDYKKVDVYAYSLVIYYVVTGLKPWSQIGPSEIEELVLNGERPDFPDNKLIENSRKLIVDCWDRDPTNRPDFDTIIAILSNWFAV